MRYPHVSITGLQWGDEGKGKMVTFFVNQDYDIVVRYQGGNNAGHTLKTVYEGLEKTFKVHLIPSYVTRLDDGMVGVIGNDVALDPGVLIGEIANLEREGIYVTPENLRISNNATVITHYDKVLDGASRLSKNIGTTKRGIGPAYSRWASRAGIPLHYLFDEDMLEAGIDAALPEVIALCKLHGVGWLDRRGIKKKKFMEELLRQGEILEPYAADIRAFLMDAMDSGERVIFEGAQGAMLDNKFGTYPMVTSSRTGFWGIHGGTGVEPVGTYKLGVVKAYTTRVGEGDFVCFGDPENEEKISQLSSEIEGLDGEERERKLVEMFNSDDEDRILFAIVEKGAEFGTTTGRRRRAGPLDGPQIRYASELTGLGRGRGGIALTKIDVLSGMKKIPVVTEYFMDDRGIVKAYDPTIDYSEVYPLTEDIPGFSLAKEDWDGIRDKGFSSPRGLPKELRPYIEAIEELSGAPVDIISYGPLDDETIVRKGFGEKVLRSA